MRRILWLLFCGALSACAVTQSSHAPEPLYVTMEIRQHGQTVAAPRLVGFEGHRITAERALSAGVSPYRLQLQPEETENGYHILLDVQLPSGRSVGQIGLLHGEERRITLDADTELTLMLMRVDSEEFRALMRDGSPNAVRM